MVLRLVPETEERDSNSPQGRRLTFNGHGHRVSLGWQRRGGLWLVTFPPSPRRVGAEEGGRILFATLNFFFLIFGFLSF